MGPVAADISALTAVREEIEGLPASDSVLLLGTAGDHPVDAVCGALLDRHGPERTHFVGITFDDTPAAVLEDWEDHVGQLPHSSSIIVTSQGSGPAPTLPESVSTSYVRDPRDIARLGITISGSIESAAEHVVCCFDSLTALLQYAELQRVYRFVHTLKGRLDRVDASTHYHLDPAAHDQRTISTLEPLFDTVIEVGTDGHIDVQK